ncbi:hypothetical protein GCM10027341_27290 [Spirosoma knui]
MDMVLMPADQLRTMMIEAASIAVKHNLPQSRLAVPPDELLTPEEAAQFLKISKVSLWSWEKRGIVKGRHIGNLKRYSRNALLALGAEKGGQSA